MNIFKYVKVFSYLIFLTSCGYTSIYKNMNDVNFTINLSEMNGIREINNIVRLNLKPYTLKVTQKTYNIITNSEYKKNIITRDASGAVTEYKIYLDIIFKVNSENYNEVFEFSESFNMQSMSDKIDEKDYEESIKTNLINIITEDLISNLSRVK